MTEPVLSRAGCGRWVIAAFVVIALVVIVVVGFEAMGVVE